METPLRAYATHREITFLKAEGHVVIVEPNGDEHPVNCVCRPDGTEIGGNGPNLEYLNRRYGDVAVCTTVREAVLTGEIRD